MIITNGNSTAAAAAAAAAMIPAAPAKVSEVSEPILGVDPNSPPPSSSVSTSTSISPTYSEEIATTRSSSATHPSLQSSQGAFDHPHSTSTTSSHIDRADKATTTVLISSNTTSPSSASNSSNTKGTKTETNANSTSSSPSSSLPATTSNTHTNTTTNTTTTTSSSSNIKTKSKKSKQKQAQNLRNEMKYYIKSKARTTAYRAASYRPSIETFQSVSFENYVRSTLLGVDVDGVTSDEPYYSDGDEDSEASDEEKEGSEEEDENVHGENRVNHNDNAYDDNHNVEVNNKDERNIDFHDKEMNDNYNDVNNEKDKFVNTCNEPEEMVLVSKETKNESELKNEIDVEMGDNINVNSKQDEEIKETTENDIDYDNDTVMVDINGQSSRNEQQQQQHKETNDVSLNDTIKEKEVVDTVHEQSNDIQCPSCSEMQPSSMDPLIVLSCSVNNQQIDNNDGIMEQSISQDEKESMTSSEVSTVPAATPMLLTASKSSSSSKESESNICTTQTEKNIENNGPSSSTSPSQSETTNSTRRSSRRMTTRFQTKSIPKSSPEKENVYSKPKYISPKALREEQEKLRKKRKEDQATKKREAAKKKELLLKEAIQACKCSSSPQKYNAVETEQKGSNKRTNPSLSTSSTTTVSPLNLRKRSPRSSSPIIVPAIQKLEYDSLKLSEGIAKIIPPEGWWDYAGIGKDLTGRGEAWQAGTKLGDMIIPSPIKQSAFGIGGVYDFTMLELPTVTVAEFRKQADEYRKRHLGKEFDDEEDYNDDEKMDMLARKFWKRLGPTMESSKYGADMEGSLFEGDDACGWNVDKLDSCLKLLLADVNQSDIEAMKDDGVTAEDFRMPGVTSAYLYFGMWASVFCAHTEDMNLCSINYLHAGAPKYWYAISTEDRGRFESLMASTFSHQNSTCKEFLRHKKSLISPSILTKAGIEYTTQVQRAGEIIITYPGSYHFGFNTGFNVAESTNFAVPEWISIGEEAGVCMCHPHSVRIDMKRFKVLLHEYERDQIINIRNGGVRESHELWARNNLKSKMSKRQKNYDDNDELSKALRLSKFSKGMVVEVVKLTNSDDKSKSNKKSSKKRKVSSKKQAEAEDFRIAKRLTKSSLCHKKHTPVLCLLESGSEYNYFAGHITALVDDYARIHFVGSSKAEDIWMELASGNLFLDGGPAEKP